jgi:hypothetical protein
MVCRRPLPRRRRSQVRAFRSRADGRSSDLQAIPFPEFPTGLRFPIRFGSVLHEEAFVPAYRCGAVLDSHQIPCCHTRLPDVPTALVRLARSSAVKKAHFSGLPLLPSGALQLGYLGFLLGIAQAQISDEVPSLIHRQDRTDRRRVENGDPSHPHKREPRAKVS